MRWTWLIPRVILVSLLWAAVAFGLDPWLRYTAVQTLQSVTGARADIAALNTGVFPPTLTINGVALASASEPSTNLLEFDELQCRLGGQALLRRSIVVDEARLSGVRFGTVRNDDGQLEAVSEDAAAEPSWLTEKLSDAGDAWLQQLITDVRSQLDPDTLETWRTGQMLSVKWEQRIETLQNQLNSLEPRVNRLQEQMDAAKKLGSVARVERYLQLVAQGEQLLREANHLQQQIQVLVPEVREDLKTLDQARKNDQQQVVQKIRMLKPTPRRITESLIGPEMYRRMHQALSWLELGKQYRSELRSQTKVVRHRGRDFEFPVQNQTPRFLCRRMEISGELSTGQQLMPFLAVLSDVSSDPALLGQPAVFRLKGSGAQPLQLAVRHDAAAETPATDIMVQFAESSPRHLRVGQQDTALLTTGLSGLRWSAQFRLKDEHVDGVIRLNSALQHAEVTSDKMSPFMKSAVVDVLRGIDSVDAAVQVTGTIQTPQVQIESELGRQVAAGLQTALTRQAEHVQAALTTQVRELAAQQQRQLTEELNERYQTLVADHRKMFEKIQGAQRLLAGARSAPSDPVGLFRQASESGLLPPKQEEQIDRQLKKRSQLLQGIGEGIFR